MEWRRVEGDGWYVRLHFVEMIVVMALAQRNKVPMKTYRALVATNHPLEFYIKSGRTIGHRRPPASMSWLRYLDQDLVRSVPVREFRAALSAELRAWKQQGHAETINLEEALLLAGVGMLRAIRREKRRAERAACNAVSDTTGATNEP